MWRGGACTLASFTYVSTEHKHTHIYQLPAFYTGFVVFLFLVKQQFRFWFPLILTGPFLSAGHVTLRAGFAASEGPLTRLSASFHAGHYPAFS